MSSAVATSDMTAADNDPDVLIDVRNLVMHFPISEGIVIKRKSAV